MKISSGERIFKIINFVFMILLCIITLYPYINQLAVSLNDSSDTIFGGITIYPRQFTLQNFITVFANSGFVEALVNSVIRVLIGTASGLIVITGAAYALMRKNLPGRNFFLSLLIIPTFISGGLIPTYILYRYLSLMNSFMVYILPMAFSFYYMIIIRTYLQSIPQSLEESAVIDGANELQILIQIILPLSLPVMATVTLWLGVQHWNDWVTSLYFITKSDLYTLQYIMYKVVKEAELVNQMAAQQAMTGGGVQVPKVTPESVKSATIIIATLPIIMLYPFLQKYFIHGVMIGAIKE